MAHLIGAIVSVFKSNRYMITMMMMMMVMVMMMIIIAFKLLSLCLPFLPFSYQICEFLYEKKHLYDRIIDCYLRDPLRKVTYRLIKPHVYLFDLC